MWQPSDLSHTQEFNHVQRDHPYITSAKMLVGGGGQMLSIKKDQRKKYTFCTWNVVRFYNFPINAKTCWRNLWMVPKVKGSNVLRFKRYTYAQAHITFYSCTTICLWPNYQLHFWVIAHYCQEVYGVSNSQIQSYRISANSFCP